MDVVEETLQRHLVGGCAGRAVRAGPATQNPRQMLAHEAPIRTSVTVPSSKCRCREKLRCSGPRLRSCFQNSLAYPRTGTMIMGRVLEQGPYGPEGQCHRGRLGIRNTTVFGTAFASLFHLAIDTLGNACRVGPEVQPATLSERAVSHAHGADSGHGCRHLPLLARRCRAPDVSTRKESRAMDQPSIRRLDTSPLSHPSSGLGGRDHVRATEAPFSITDGWAVSASGTRRSTRRHPASRSLHLLHSLTK